MSAGQWDELPYERVPSVAMWQYKEAFVKRNESRVANFFHEVRTGEAKIQVDGLLPHEIIARALVGEDDEATELQWRGMVSALAAKGRLTNCIAACGISKGVDEAPVVAALALGLLISELSEEPWKGRLITFDATQQLHKVRGVTLKEKLRSLAALKAKIGANLLSVFDQIINIAVDGDLAKDKMVKRVFVFSDMEFYGGGEVWETDYEAITGKFAEARYGEVVPEIVFWNVGASKARMPAVSAQKGVALVSGFSKNLVKLFLESDGELTPAAVMAEAISGLEYDSLEVFD